MYLNITSMLSQGQMKRVEEAYDEATKSHCYHRHGCVIVGSGRVLGRGYNNSRTRYSDKIIGDCMTCHAEMAVFVIVKSNKWEVPHRASQFCYLLELHTVCC